mgnify:CR=1 FL=1
MLHDKPFVLVLLFDGVDDEEATCLSLFPWPLLLFFFSLACGKSQNGTLERGLSAVVLVSPFPQPIIRKTPFHGKKLSAVRR